MPGTGVSRIGSFFLAAALCGLATQAPAASGSGICEWRAPAQDPFAGDVPDAVDDYTDIPAPNRARLKARMKAFAYDDIVSIRRSTIEGNFRYEPALLDMHFGTRRICGKVTRNSWHPDHEQRALAYCEDGHCVAVPLICRNVSRIVRKSAVTARGVPAAAGGPADPLIFDPPAAGLPPVPAAVDEAGPTAHPLLAPPRTAARMPPATDLPLASTPLQPLPPAAETPVAGVPPWPASPAPPAEVPPVVATPPAPPELPSLPPGADPTPAPALPTPGIPPLPPAPAVPEPATALLWAVGLAAGALWVHRRRGGSERSAQR